VVRVRADYRIEILARVGEGTLATAKVRFPSSTWRPLLTSRPWARSCTDWPQKRQGSLCPRSRPRGLSCMAPIGMPRRRASRSHRACVYCLYRLVCVPPRPEANQCLSPKRSSTSCPVAPRPGWDRRPASWGMRLKFLSRIPILRTARRVGLAVAAVIARSWARPLPWSKL
jgi:hypothetical protein